ncbi:hypothetical protein GCM10022216_14630 [Sphingobacterium kyonggiense]|uniref:Uncharacterized protein n=1 Tax=Sphingobacterium kyonggiense TaxID=714075 RepID=A0ABP7YLJ9_9SPHI
MLSIVKEPQPINYSRSIPDLVIQTDGVHSEITMEIALGETNVIISEKYDVTPDNKIVIKLKDILGFYLENNMPQYSDLITIHEDAFKSFRITVSEVGYTIIRDYQVISGFLRVQPFDIEHYFRNYWLNLLPSISKVYLNQPLYLTALPSKAVTVKIKAKMSNGEEKVISAGNMLANKLQSVNLNPQKVMQLLAGEFQYFDVFTVDSQDDLIHGYKRFYYDGTYNYQSDIFLYLNRLGGWDCLVINGENIIRNIDNRSTAIVQDKEVEFDYDHKLEFEKSTGFMATEEDHRQYLDFIASRKKYFLHNGTLVPIVTSENKIDHSIGKLNSYSFVFRLANIDGYFPEIGLAPYHLNIT